MTRRDALRSLGALAALPLLGVSSGQAVARQDGARKWALLIGIDQYKDTNRINNLGAAAADAKALKRLLVEKMGFIDDPVHIDLLVSDGSTKPTREEILGALTRLKSRSKPGDFVFVFYAGHGMEIAGKSYMLPFDTNALSDEDITDTALETAKFQERLRPIQAGMLFLCFDMCRSNPVNKKRDGIDKDTAKPNNPLTANTARTLDFSKAASGDGGVAGPTLPKASLVLTLYACSPDERAFEDRLRSRGYFSWYLEQGLRGAASADTSGKVTVSSLTDYLVKTVPDAVKDAENGAIQTPYPIPAGPGAMAYTLVAGGNLVEIKPVVTMVDTKARLQIAVNAPNAVVKVNGVALTGNEFIANLAGEEKRTVSVAVTAPGYEGQELSVEIVKGRTVPLTITLPKMPNAIVVPKPLPTTFKPPLTLAEYKAQMVMIPAGEFIMGSSEGKADQKPVHKVSLSAYRIGRTAVTVAIWEEFCRATGRLMPPAPYAPEFNPHWTKKDHPIVNVSWTDLMVDDGDKKCFRTWSGLTLPTEAQWEKAARGTEGLSDGKEPRKYPWGSDWDPKKLWSSTAKSGDSGGTRVVGDFPSGASPYGCLDMAGNVWEWCLDWYEINFYESRRAKEIDPVNDPPQKKEARVFRGGGWDDHDPLLFRVSFRFPVFPESSDFRLNFHDNVGFRCVLPSP